MLRIAISCGEGFASGFLSRHLTQSVVKEKLQDKVSFIFIPFYQLYDRQEEVDIAMILPHIEPQAKADKREYNIPLYIIPFKVVIKPTASDYLADAEDIMELSGGKGGLYCFPGEEFLPRVSRLECHREYVKKKNNKKSGWRL